MTIAHSISLAVYLAIGLYALYIIHLSLKPIIQDTMFGMFRVTASTIKAAEKVFYEFYAFFSISRKNDDGQYHL